MTGNVRALPGSKVPSNQPNPDLIAAIERTLQMAKEGQLQSFIGTGFTSDGLRAALWADTEPDVYKMLGALEWLKSEYVHRHISEV